MLNPEGELINRDAKSALSTGGVERFPWAPPSLEEALGPVLLNPYGDRVPVDSVVGAGKHVALFFGAQWCPPCRAFAPRLGYAYQRLRSEGAAFEVIYVSSDHDVGRFEEARQQAPWLALPFEDRERRDLLAGMYGVTGVPTLVVLDPRGGVVSRNARGALERGGEFPWAPRLVPEVDEREEWGANPVETPTLVVLEERNGDQWEKVEAALGLLAKEAAARSAGGSPGMLFMVAKDRQGLAQVLAQMRCPRSDAMP